MLKESKWIRRITGLVGVAWSLALVAICLTPSTGEAPTEIWGGWWPEYEGLAVYILNVFLYLPLGGVLAMRLRSARSGLLGGLLLSVAVETAQLWIPGRHTSVADVTANSLGAWIGAVLLVRRNFWFAPIGRPSQVIALTWLGIAGATLASVGPVLTPAVPNTTLYSSWTPRLGSLEHYDGEVLSARVGDVILPEGGPIAPELQARVSSHLWRPEAVELTFVAGSATPGLAPVLRVVGQAGQEVLLVGVDGADIVVRRRYVADNLRMARPDLRMRGVFSRALPGDTIHVTLEREAGGVEVLTVNGDIGEMGFSPARGWSVFRYNSAWPKILLASFDFAWLVLLAFPFGWWARSLLLLIVGSSLLSSALLVLPRFAGTFSGTVVQAAAIVCIAGSGYALRAIMDRRLGGSCPTETPHRNAELLKLEEIGASSSAGSPDT